MHLSIHMNLYVWAEIIVSQLKYLFNQIWLFVKHFFPFIYLSCCCCSPLFCQYANNVNIIVKKHKIFDENEKRIKRYLVETIAVCSFSVICPLRVIYSFFSMFVRSFVHSFIFLVFFFFSFISSSILVFLIHPFGGVHNLLQSNLHPMIGMRVFEFSIFACSNIHQFRTFVSQVVISSVLILIIDELFGLQQLFEIRLIRPEKKWSLFKKHCI